MAGILKTVGRYEILREIGRGGMATVYLARQTDLDRFIALKELATFRASDPSFAERFVRESRVAGSLSHPNIVTVHDSFEDDGTPYIAMEYVERGSLLELRGSDTFVGPSADYAKAVGNTFAALNSAVAAGQAKLAKAKTPAAQATAARQIQNAYRHAAAILRRLQLSPADRGINARLAAALGALAEAYGQAATAAAHHDKAGFQKARAAITKDQGGLNAAIANLRDAGYEVQS
jgi:Protein kinase domain